MAHYDNHPFALYLALTNTLVHLMPSQSEPDQAKTNSKQVRSPEYFKRLNLQRHQIHNSGKQLPRDTASQKRRQPKIKMLGFIENTQFIDTGSYFPDRFQLTTVEGKFISY